MIKSQKYILSKETQKKLKKQIKYMEIKNGMLKNLKIVKCLWEEMITYKNKLVKIFKAKPKC